MFPASVPKPMSNILKNMGDKFQASAALRRAGFLAWRELRGFAKDFWYDGNWAIPDDLDEVEPPPKKPPPKSPRRRQEEEDGLWHALAGEVSEKMWGKHCVTPGDEHITELLIRPLGLTKDMSVLDLSAGLGWRLRRTTDEFGVYINGFEPDAEIAARGMELSRLAGKGKRAAIAVYDPMNFVSTRTYDCVLGRETIYRVADKEKFIKSIAACCKPQAQLSFTDYVVDPEVADHPSILAWKAYEQSAAPPTLVDMAGLWAKAGFTLRVHDDQTEYYKQEVVAGMKRLAVFLASGIKPAPETKRTISKRVTTWAHRMAALEAGMKFYRFYGLR